MARLNRMQQFVKSADRSIVLSSLQRLLPGGVDLLPTGNRYKHNSALSRDDDDANVLRVQDLTDYVAVSALHHCIDGWKYLGRSIQSHLVGDANISRHLGYYAELRGAMALLAAEGMGTFNARNFALRNTGNGPRKNSDHTHTFVWKALSAWADKPGVDGRVLDVISPMNMPLKSWLNSYFQGQNLQFSNRVARTWILEWGIDLQRFYDDRNSRNESSYRPTAFVGPNAPEAKAALETISMFWESLEPTGNSRFGWLDRAMLKRSMERMFDARNPGARASERGRRQYEQKIIAMIDHLGVSTSDIHKARLVSLFTDAEVSKGFRILDLAAQNDPMSSPDHHIQVMARATLLLRIATGFVEKLLSSAGIDLTQMDLWRDDVGIKSALWRQGTPPDEMVDLWADIEEGLEVADTRIADWNNGQVGYKEMQEQCSSEMLLFGTCERIGLWGMGF